MPNKNKKIKGRKDKAETFRIKLSFSHWTHEKEKKQQRSLA